MSRLVLALLTGLLLQACSGRVAEQHASEWDRSAVDTKEKPADEQEVPLPAYPRAADLIEFEVGSGAHRYFIDGRTLEVGADGVVRYALVVRTAGGASSASYEGIRCATQEKRIYAVGHPQGKWIPARRSVWEPIVPGRANEHQAVLYKDFFCPDRIIVPSRDAALRALRNQFTGRVRAPAD
jgi:hypothetical protein